MMSKVLLVFLAATTLISAAVATCDCICSAGLIAQPYIVELAATGECFKPDPMTGSSCYDIDCAKCGKSLECYVKTNSPQTDSAICDAVNDLDTFCPTIKGKNRFTSCNQQCSGDDGVTCYPGEKWGTCPAVLGSPYGTAQCKKGATSGSAELSNFASYTVCLGSTGATCTASGSCTKYGAMYECKTATPCMSSRTTINCKGSKCDGSDGSTTCECAQ